MEQLKLTETAEFKSSDGTTFTYKAKASRGDKYEMNSAMMDNSVSTDGKTIETKPGRLYPWLIQNFVIGWSRGAQTSGKEILNVLLAEDADPKEDLILVLGAHIFVNVKGLIAQPDDSVKKKG